jgi:hypothetical protein
VFSRLAEKTTAATDIYFKPFFDGEEKAPCQPIKGSMGPSAISAFSEEVS